ncbi:TFIIA-alpha and beta-like factor [Octopus vulgaris]|uniref:TFIIA-alpha and beta-like factor n=1 Tax=Octopus vulgaris TaxID=6645 RepID=A0AA36BWJ7_OCTVU|nr:TFIIA-alpha and beta-like factor [Octopus vulgaris]
MSDPVAKFYKSVVEDVVQSSRELFIEEGIDETVLTDMKEAWLKKIHDSKVFEFSKVNRTNVDGYGIISPACSNNNSELFVPSIHLAGPRMRGPRSSCTTATIALPYGLYNQQIRDLNNAGISLQRNRNGHFLAILPPEQHLLQPVPTAWTSENSGESHSVNDNNKPTSRCPPSNFNLPSIYQAGRSPSKLHGPATKTPLPLNVAVISESTAPTTTSSSLSNATDRVISSTAAVHTNVNSAKEQNNNDNSNANDPVGQLSTNGSELLGDAGPNNGTRCGISEKNDSNSVQQAQKSLITTQAETSKANSEFLTSRISSFAPSCHGGNLEQNYFCSSNQPNRLPVSSLSHQDNFTGYPVVKPLPPFYDESRTSVDNTPSTLEDFLEDISGPLSQNCQSYIPDEHPKFPPADTTTANNNNNNNNKPTLLNDSLGQTSIMSVASSSDNSCKGSGVGKICQLSEEDMKTIEEILQMDGTTDAEIEDLSGHNLGNGTNVSSVRVKRKYLNMSRQCDGENTGSTSSSDNNNTSKDEDSSSESGSSNISDEIDEAIVDIGIESDPLNTADDDSDADICAMFESENVIVCQFVKISRIKNKWKFQLKDGILNLFGRDMLFSKAVGDAEW